MVFDISERGRVVLNRLNNKFDNLLCDDFSGQKTPFVCILCDRFVHPRNHRTISLEQLMRKGQILSNEFVPSSIRNDYLYNDVFTERNERLKELLHSMLLSPRAVFISNFHDRRRATGYTACKNCKDSLLSSNDCNMPRHAIANNYFFGTPPPELTDLTDVELAMLSPVKTSGNFGYCFGYTGGTKNSLKGNLTFLKVDINRLIRAVAHFDVLGLHDCVVVLLYGKMTEAQRKKARDKARIRPAYLLRAIEWLRANNIEWQYAPSLDYFRRHLKKPVVVDSTTEAASENENIETKEQFSVFFPDGRLSSLNGGQNNIDTWKTVIEEAKRRNYDIGFQCDLQKEMVADFKDRNLVNSCLLQFPYGVGGMHESRLKPDGSRTNRISMQTYLEHLSMISQPHFHRELFVLILYNMHMRQQMVKTAGIRVGGGVKGGSLLTDLSIEDVSSALHSRRHGIHRTGPGAKFTGALESIAKSVPHSNESTMRARSDGYAHQFYFGVASYFLTVTPDDENSVILQIYSNIKIDHETEDVAALSDEDLTIRARQRQKLRVSFPGLCALFFEQMLDIVIEDVIGWDIQQQCARQDIVGLFGTPTAFSVAVEEQGRRTLHAHIQVWNAEFSRAREALHSTNQLIKLQAQQFLCKEVDAVCSNKLISTDFISTRRFRDAFPHVCDQSRDRPPTVCNDQRLRILRHVSGRHEVSNQLSYCPDCLSKAWTSEELVESFLMHGINIPSLTHYPENNTNRLKTTAIHYQMAKGDERDQTKQLQAVINAAYNHHIHTGSCWQHATLTPSGTLRAATRSKNKKKRKKINNNECRYRYPKRPKHATTIQNAYEVELPWFTWDGLKQERHLKEFCIRRHRFDAFQNTSCPAISLSKLTCNTNVSPMTPGPVSQYQLKYKFKDQQEEEQAEPKKVCEKLQNTLITVSQQLEEDVITERTGALKALLSASFQQQSKNVVGAAMAAFLTRKKSRFIFSHPTVWCPVEDILKLFCNDGATATIKYNDETPFCSSKALDYLCRPKELESLNPIDFYSYYEVIIQNKDNEKDLLQLLNTATFTHSSWRKKESKFLQGVRKRFYAHIVKFRFWSLFPDSSVFSCSLRDPNATITPEMETYSQSALLLFLSYRTHDRLLLEGSYTKRLRSAILNGEVTELHLTYLQNMQDTQRNALRNNAHADDLQRCTTAHEPGDNILNAIVEDDESDTESEQDYEDRMGQDINDFLNELYNDDRNRDARDTPNTVPSSLTFRDLKDKGSKDAGYSMLTSQRINVEDHNDFLEVQHDGHRYVQDNGASVGHNPTTQQRIYINEMVKIYFENTQRRSRSFAEITGHSADVEVLEANGSVASIIDWAEKAGLDDEQRRAFEIMTGTLVLTFRDDAEDGIDPQNMHSRRQERQFGLERNKLLALVDAARRKSTQLVLLLHGPGGCGKTTVLDLMMSYMKDFCQPMTDFEFTDRTVVVTALTGVAATLLLGQTTHTALYINQRRRYTEQQVRAWENTKMVIVDEISFADKKVVRKMHEVLTEMKQNKNAKFGGVHVVFSGDFRQLEPVSKTSKPLYRDNCTYFRDFINCYIELHGLHRFRNDMAWGRLLTRLRNGKATRADIEEINRRVVLDPDCLPPDLKYATYFNKDRDSINAALFEKRCTERIQQGKTLSDTLLILADQMLTKDADDNWVQFRATKTVWEHCGEDDMKPSSDEIRERVDPVLKLYKGCRVMLPTNEDVANGLANGTQATVEKVVLKPGHSPVTVMLNDALPVPAVLASQVQEVILSHSNDRIRPNMFSLKPKKTAALKARIPTPENLRCEEDQTDKIPLKFFQIPMILNNATTGHKLQGSSVDDLFVHQWKYVQNWAYVVLSRVRTIRGLFLREPLSLDMSLYKMDKSLTKMLSHFRQMLPTTLSEEQYSLLLR